MIRIKGREVRVIAVDYDGTLAPIGVPFTPDVLNMRAVEALKTIQGMDVELVLWTCQKGENLASIVKACGQVGLVFDAVNENAPRHMQRWLAAHPEDIGVKQSPKVYADLYIDDNARLSGQIDWDKLRKQLLSSGGDI